MLSSAVRILASAAVVQSLQVEIPSRAIPFPPACLTFDQSNVTLQYCDGSALWEVNGSKLVWVKDETMCLGYTKMGIHIQLQDCADVGDLTWEFDSRTGAISATSTLFTETQCLYFVPNYPTPQSKPGVGLADCDGSIQQGWFLDPVPDPVETTTGVPEPGANTTSGVPGPVETTNVGPEPVANTTTGAAEPNGTTTTGAPEPAETTTAAPAPETPSRIRSFMELLPQLCVDLPGGDISNGAVLWMWDCYGGDTQHWSFQDGQFKYAADTSKCMDLLGGDTSNGNLVGLWDCYDGDNQQWGYDSEALTIYLASSVASDATKCLQLGGPEDVPSVAAGKQLKIWDCDGGLFQQWYVEDDAQSGFAVV